MTIMVKSQKCDSLTELQSSLFGVVTRQALCADAEDKGKEKSKAGKKPQCPLKDEKGHERGGWFGYNCCKNTWCMIGLDD